MKSFQSFITETTQGPFEVSIQGGQGHVVADVKAIRTPTLAELKTFKESIHDDMMEEWEGSDPDLMGTTYEINFTGLNPEGIAFFRDHQNTIEGAGNEIFDEGDGLFTVHFGWVVDGVGKLLATKTYVMDGNLASAIAKDYLLVKDAIDKYGNCTYLSLPGDYPELRQEIDEILDPILTPPGRRPFPWEPFHE